MKQVTINFILHERHHYLKVVARELAKLSLATKQLIGINLLVSKSDDCLENTVKLLKHAGIDVSVFLHKTENNYMQKIYTAFQNSGEYIISIDEDIFIPKNVWEYFITNISILDNSEYAFLSPIINTGIPSVDLFTSHFLNQAESEELANIYTSTHIPNIWGADYSDLNRFTTGSNTWDSNGFYNAVDKINHHYKGVHPLRFSYAAQKFVNSFCIKNIDHIVEQSAFSMNVIERPYFCNSVFGIKKDLWEKIIFNRELFRDDFDEVPLNLYIKNNNLKMVFINNGIAIHPSYNTVNIYGHNYEELSDEFFQHEYFK